jgi:lipoyl(octanoyl) transferase
LNTFQKTFLCRLLFDPPQSGAWNMAVDEAMLAEAVTSGTASLRFYEWNEPTLSLGYFQKYADRATHPASVEAACIRRQSGGGAIMHDHELTYSLTLPKSHPLSSDAQTLYKAVHGTIVAVLRRHLPEGVSPSQLYTYDADSTLPVETEPFLCFARRSRGDILFAAESPGAATVTHKIVGSAQRRNRGAVLQHGSILISRSGRSPELAGLGDLCDNDFDTTFLTSELSGQILESLKLVIAERTLSNQAFAMACALQDEKYRNRHWTQRR